MCGPPSPQPIAAIAAAGATYPHPLAVVLVTRPNLFCCRICLSVTLASRKRLGVASARVQMDWLTGPRTTLSNTRVLTKPGGNRMAPARRQLATQAFLLCTFLAGGALGQAAPPAQSPANAGWVGEIAAGGAVATGNTSRRAFDLDLRAVKREGGVENRYRFVGDVAWQSGVTTSQRVQASAQTNVDIRDRMYGFATAALDDNRFSGYRYEINASLGLGYRLIDTGRTLLSMEAGPGYRIAKVRTTGEEQNAVFARFYSVFRHEISDTARLTNDLLVTFDHITTRIDDTVAVTSKLVGNLSGRVSFNVRHDTEPRPGVKKTDTLTKLSLVYGF